MLTGKPANQYSMLPRQYEKSCSVRIVELVDGSFVKQGDGPLRRDLFQSSNPIQPTIESAWK